MMGMIIGGESDFGNSSRNGDGGVERSLGQGNFVVREVEELCCMTLHHPSANQCL